MVFIILQGPKGEGMVNSLNERRVFGSFSERRAAAPLPPPPGGRRAPHPPTPAERRLPEPSRARRALRRGTCSRNFVSIFTWGLVGGFLLLSALLALKQ